MTNKEAIRILGLECDEWDISHCTASERREAFDMAITALQVHDKFQDIEYMCRPSGGADYFHAFRAISSQQETCSTCKHGYFGDEQCNDCRVRFTSHYERRIDEQTKD